MNYLEGRKAGEEKDLKWAEYFDVVIVGGNKPAFLEDDRYMMQRGTVKSISVSYLILFRYSTAFNPAEASQVNDKRRDK